jgi:hypothetical protein
VTRDQRFLRVSRIAGCHVGIADPAPQQRRARLRVHVTGEDCAPTVASWQQARPPAKPDRERGTL